MKKRNAIFIVLVATLLLPSYAYAEEVADPPVVSEPVSEPVEEPVSEPAEEPVSEPAEEPQESANNDTLPPPSEELISEDPWANSSLDPEPNNSEVDPASQDEPESWAVVDENGNTLNIIVCDIDYCGSGWIPAAYDGFTPTEWHRVVRQSERNPQTGESNGGHWGQYNFSSGEWTEQRGDSLYQIPTEYGSDPICLENCVTEEINEDPEIPLSSSESTTLVLNETTQQVDERSLLTKINKNVDERTFSFIHKSHWKKRISKGKIWVIATNQNKKMVWKFNVNKKGKTLITIPIKYINWDFMVNYKLKNKYVKNNKKISTKINIKE